MHISSSYSSALRRAGSMLLIGALWYSQVVFVGAQIVTEPMPEPESTPVMSTSTEPVAPEPIVAPEPEDTTPPGFISVATASADETQATVMWTTDEPAFGFVEYGETTNYGSSTAKSGMATMDGSASITGLTPGTTYHYRIIVEDASGNVTRSEDRIAETAAEIVIMDNVPPQIAEVTVSHITPSGATIGWTTDELAQGTVEYGATGAYGSSAAATDDYAEEHSVALADLEPGTEYHFRVMVRDESGNGAVSPDELFTTSDSAVATSTSSATTTEETATSTTATTTEATAPIATTTEETATSTTATSTEETSGDGTATTTEETASSTTVTTTEETSGGGTVVIPAEFAIYQAETVSVGTSTATITWNTNKQAYGNVSYGPGEPHASSTVRSGITSVSHTARLTKLTPGTNYGYRIFATNISGKTIELGGFEFNTLFEQKKAVAPSIANVVVKEISTSTALILFDTNIPATGIVNYGTSTGYEQTDGGHHTLLTAHSHPLTGLSQDTPYNFEIIVRDEAGNSAIHENVTFRTLAAQGIPVSSGSVVVPVAASAGGIEVAAKGVPARVVGKPTITKVEAMDGEALFVWRPATEASGLRTVIVRGDQKRITTPAQGTIVYQGNSGHFADIGLENGTQYRYAIFRVNKVGMYSIPIHVTVTPKSGKTQTDLIALPAVVQKTPIYVFSKKLSRGDTDTQIEHLQVLLASEPALYPQGLITGHFGPLTEQAVKLFQKRHALAATGVADAATLRKFEALSGYAIVNDRAAVFSDALPRELYLGSMGGDVSVLQQFLVNVEAYPEALVTGYFGPLTQAAVQRFQTEQNISPTSGHFGPLTKKRMLNLIRLRGVSF